MKATQESIAETLTKAEREAPFALAAAELDPLPACTRTATVWDGHRFTEYDPATWQAIALGEVTQC